MTDNVIKFRPPGRRASSNNKERSEISERGTGAAHESRVRRYQRVFVVFEKAIETPDGVRLEGRLASFDSLEQADGYYAATVFEYPTARVVEVRVYEGKYRSDTLD